MKGIPAPWEDSHICVLKKPILLRHQIIPKLLYDVNATPIKIPALLYVYPCVASEVTLKLIRKNNGGEARGSVVERAGLRQNPDIPGKEKIMKERKSQHQTPIVNVKSY